MSDYVTVAQGSGIEVHTSQYNPLKIEVTNFPPKEYPITLPISGSYIAEVWNGCLVLKYEDTISFMLGKEYLSKAVIEVSAERRIMIYDMANQTIHNIDIGEDSVTPVLSAIAQETDYYPVREFTEHEKDLYKAEEQDE